jgi:hypothetical protein
VFFVLRLLSGGGCLCLAMALVTSSSGGWRCCLLHRRGAHVCRWRIWGLPVWCLVRGSGVSLVAFRNELHVFYLLNLCRRLWAPTAPRWLPSARASACTSPRRGIQLSLAAPPFASAFLGGLRAGRRGDVWAVGRGVSKVAVGGYHVGAVSGQTAWRRRR